MRALLDVNFLIALLDAAHVHHRAAHDWWAANHDAGWASCAITENGVVRIMSLPAYRPDRPIPPGELVDRLRLFAAHSDHEFWTDGSSLRDHACFRIDRLHRSRELTDVWLLALAVRHGGRLVTFDRRITTEPVVGAREEHLLVMD